MNSYCKSMDFATFSKKHFLKFSKSIFSMMKKYFSSNFFFTIWNLPILSIYRKNLGISASRRVWRTYTGENYLEMAEPLTFTMTASYSYILLEPGRSQANRLSDQAQMITTAITAIREGR